MDYNFEIVCDIEHFPTNCNRPSINFDALPAFSADGCIHFSDINVWSDLSADQRTCVKTLEVTMDKSHTIERSSIKQRNCKEWFTHRNGRITTSIAHRVLLRKGQFETLAQQITTQDNKLSN